MLFAGLLMFRKCVFVVVLLLPSTAHATERAILVLGDSLSAAHGIALDAGWVAKLQTRLKREGYSHQVINASISGETTHGGNRRLEALLAQARPSVTIIELGGNDGLRGLPLADIEDNLLSMIKKTAAAGSRPLLVEMLLPPNYGNEYVEKFVGIYRRLGRREDVTLAPFILKGVADNPNLMQDDGIHPTTEAQQTILDNLWPSLRPLLKKTPAP